MFEVCLRRNSLGICIGFVKQQILMAGSSIADGVKQVIDVCCSSSRLKKCFLGLVKGS